MTDARLRETEDMLARAIDRENRLQTELDKLREERDAALKENREMHAGWSDYKEWKAGRDSLTAQLATIRAETIEECAKVADNHEREREEWQTRHNRGRQFFSDEAKASIMDEARGERIASEIIAKAIRTLAAKEE